MDFLPSACRATYAQAADLGRARGTRVKRRRGKKRAAGSRKAKKRTKARKLKFGSPAWRKKYMKRGR